MNKIYKFEISDYKNDDEFYEFSDPYIELIKNPPEGHTSLELLRTISLYDADKMTDDEYYEAFLKDKPELTDVNRVKHISICENILRRLFPDAKIKVSYNDDYENQKKGFTLFKTGSGSITMKTKSLKLFNTDDIKLFRLVLYYCGNMVDVGMDDKNRLYFIFEFKKVNKRIG